MSKIRFVTATKVLRAPTCSFKFMFEGNMPRDWVRSGGYWGMILPMEDKCPGQDTQIYVFQSGKGQVLSGAFNSAPEDTTELTDILTKGWLPEESILLIDEALLKRIEPALNACGCQFDIHHSGKELATA
jgi:hypothetical protein